MAYVAIAGIIPQYEDFANWWLKAYEQGTTTPKLMANDSVPTTTFAKLELDSEGFPNTTGDARLIPFIDGSYDLWLFETEAAADANDTSAPAFQVADNIENAEPTSSVSTKLNPDTAAIMTADTSFSSADVGVSVPTTKEFSTGNGGGGTYDIISGTGTANGFDIIAHDTENISFVLRKSSIMYIEQYGAAKSASDNAAAIQFAIDDAGDTSSPITILSALAETYIIDSAFLSWTTSGKKTFAMKFGARSANTTFKAGSNLAAATKPSALSGVYGPSLILDYTPIMLLDNSSRVHMEGLLFDGDGEDVYGIYQNENFFCTFKDVRVTGCNKRPWTKIRCQSNQYFGCEHFLNGQGTTPEATVLDYDCSALTYISFVTERNGTDRFNYEHFQPNNKGGITFIEPWFEAGSTEQFATLGFMSFGGRKPRIIGGYQSFGTRATTEDVVDLKAASDTLSTDNITMTTDACQDHDLDLNDISVPTMNMNVASDVKGGRIHGFFDAAKVVNNAAESNGNSFEPNTFADGSAYNSVSSGFRVSKVATTGGQPIGTTDYIALFTDNLINMFGNANNKLLLNSGILEMHSNLAMRILPGGSATIEPNSGDNVIMTFASGGTLRLDSIPTSSAGLSAGEVWNDSGTLKIV